jgi:diaminopimelate decarboxylase
VTLTTELSQTQEMLTRLRAKHARVQVQSIQAQLRQQRGTKSAAELDRIAAIASREGRRAPVALRVNPEVEPGTHPHVSTGVRGSKFGLTFDEALSVAGRAAAAKGVELLGLACHIGSQIVDIDPYLAALDRLLLLVEALRGQGIGLRHLDLGGGLGIRYRDESPPAPSELVSAVYRHPGVEGFELHFEPGRSVVGAAGILLTRVEYLKPAARGTFVIVDAAMNDLLRPALYDAWQEVVVVRPGADVPAVDCDIVGPVCESTDFLARGRRLAVREGDLLAILGAGAYGAAMASNYNSRPRPAEVLVQGTRLVEVRRREGFEDLVRGEARLTRP